MLVQQAAGALSIDVLGHGDHPFGHQLLDRCALVGSETHIPVGQNTGQFSGPPTHNRNAGDMVTMHQLMRFGQSLVRMDRHRIDDHAGLKFLYIADLGGLRLDIQIFMNYAEATGLGHGNRQTAFGDRVHGR